MSRKANDAERAIRLARMRSRTSRNANDAAASARLADAHSFDVEKLIRTRLTPEEAVALRTAFAMYESKKYPGTIKTNRLWKVLRTLGLAPTPSEFDGLVAQMDYAQKGHVKQTVFTKEMERFYTQYFSKSQDIEQAFGRVCSLTDDDPEAYSSPMHGTITADELTKAMQNLGFEMSEDLEERDNEILDMIEEIDSKGQKDIDLDDFVKMLTSTTDDLL